MGSGTTTFSYLDGQQPSAPRKTGRVLATHEPLTPDFRPQKIQATIGGILLPYSYHIKAWHFFKALTKGLALTNKLELNREKVF